MTIALVANIIFTLANSRRTLIEALVKEGHRVLLLAPDGPDREDLVGVAVTYFPLLNVTRSGLTPLKDICLIRELRNIYCQEGVDVALLFNIKPVIFGALAAVGMKARAIVTITGTGNVFLKPIWLQLVAIGLYSTALRNAELTIFQNEDDRSQFLNLGLVDNDRTLLVGGAGVDLGRFSFVPITNPKHFLFVGRLLKDKGILEFVAAARQARAIDPDVRFTVVGGLDRHNVEVINQELLTCWRAEGIVNFVGTQADIRPFLKEATCVVLPSYREGCPRVLLEGGATGRPLLTTDVAGCRSVVTDGHNGFLVPARDAVALARAMLKISELPINRLIAMGQQARTVVEEKFDQRLVNETYLRAVKQYH